MTFRLNTKISRQTWEQFVSRYGDYEARQRLRYHRPGYPLALVIQRSRREKYAILHDLLHSCGGTPSQNRAKFTTIVRQALRLMREDRERIRSFMAPGVAFQRLP